ncbi:YecA family protein [Bradyrhizobium hipponense]|uniref:YecA family protein n=1 Tax=Bradyrhizobium hipponense TaxID=2605638 RepID=UPI001AED868B|nr:SEC-C domain-containing protein [Bradyrhizobium hipponense]
MNGKSAGVTETERMLADFCERSFLKLWSYPNPFKDDGHELCDLLAVFDNHVFIFFDRENELPEGPDKDPKVVWDRWKRNVIDRQVKTAHGAERYIRSGRPIFMDAKRTAPFPLHIDARKAVIHKIIVAHGAKEACERASPDNVYGSLAIAYTETDGGPSQPFHIEIDRRKPVHILDSHNMPIVLGELDTVSDLSTYLDEKVRAASAFDHLTYCGEEDLLGHYLLNYDEVKKRHVIGPKNENEAVNGIMIGEGEWHDFIQTDLYKNTKTVDRVSYFWDELIQRTCQNSLDGTLGGNSNIFRGESAIYEMVKEPRFMRRGLAEKMLTAAQRFPDTGQFARQVTFLPSYQPNVAYVLLQLRAPDAYRAEPDYREKRTGLLEIACGAAKNKFPNLVKVVGIGIDAPKFSGGKNAEDFILMPCETWTEEMRSYYEEQNKHWNFFGTPNLRQHNDRVNQFVPPPRPSKPARSGKIDRNDRCPCGSGLKYKRCCLER